MLWILLVRRLRLFLQKTFLKLNLELHCDSYTYEPNDLTTVIKSHESGKNKQNGAQNRFEEGRQL